MMINDLPLAGYYKVFDLTTDRIIFESAGGDIPPEIATLDVIQVYCCDSILYLDVMS